MLGRKVEWKVSMHSSLRTYSNSTTNFLLLFRNNRLFELDPETKAIFGFHGRKAANLSSRGINRMGLLIHGSRIVEMIHTTLLSLGPDMDMLEDFLADLGQRHMRHGVKPKHFRILAKVFIERLAMLLGPSWTLNHTAAWVDVFYVFNTGITRDMTPSTPCREEKMVVPARAA